MTYDLSRLPKTWCVFSHDALNSSNKIKQEFTNISRQAASITPYGNYFGVDKNGQWVGSMGSMRFNNNVLTLEQLFDLITPKIEIELNLNVGIDLSTPSTFCDEDKALIASLEEKYSVKFTATKI